MPQPSDRGRVLVRIEQLAERTDRGPQVRPEFLIAFVRALIRGTFSGDTLMLALYAARDASGATEGEMKVFLEAIRNERAGHTPFSGMFQDF